VAERVETAGRTAPPRTGGGRGLRALLVDPSLFTAPYDASLTEGLVAAGVQPTWAVRPVRSGDREEIPARYCQAFFYQRVDAVSGLPSRVRKVAKGMAHVLGLARLVWRVVTQGPDVVHFQWAVVPPLDAVAMLLMKVRAAVVLTVHDSVPFNGDRLTFLQTAAFDLPIRLSDRVIVHTASARQRLLARGVPAEKVTIIPHGPLTIPGIGPATTTEGRRDPRQTFVLFGELKAYKGIDLLVEAVALLPPHVRRQTRFVVAGRAQMDLGPIRARIAALGLTELVEVREGRLSEEEMAALFAETDVFVFPYRQIDASGVYFLTKALGKWIIATRVGIFAEDLRDGGQGELVEPESPRMLAEAITRACTDRPRAAPVDTGTAWTAIGAVTAELYRECRARVPWRAFQGV
jgi:glycosyltransferase involved in cell wall biosynthesis